MRRRLPISATTRPAFRQGFRRASRHAYRRALFRAPRLLLKDNGPSLHDICNLLSRYIRVAEAYEKKWNSLSRFKTTGTPEEHRRQVSPSPTPQQNPSTGSAPHPRPKRDVVAVPLVRHANGLLSLDWSAVRD
jgi:hypothetical protein